MAASTEILIGDLGRDHVLIRPVSRSHPGLFDSWDGNWIDCEVQIVVGGFRGNFRADLRSEEFRTFLEEVERLNGTLEGTASFTAMEGQITFALTSDGNGHVRVSGEAMDDAGSGNRLRFGFDVDQTFLQTICQSLEHLMAAFPAAGGPQA